VAWTTSTTLSKPGDKHLQRAGILSFIQQHRVHDNVIVNQRGDGIMLGYYVTGDNWSTTI